MGKKSELPLLYALRHVMLAVLVALWMTAAALTHWPQLSGVPNVGDKTLHLVGYFGLAGALWLALYAYRTRLPWRPILTLAIMSAYGAIDEITQPYFQRSCDIRDWYTDVLGTLAAIVLLEMLAFVAARLRKGAKA